MMHKVQSWKYFILNCIFKCFQTFIKNFNCFAASILSSDNLSFKGSFTLFKALFRKAALHKLLSHTVMLQHFLFLCITSSFSSFSFLFTLAHLKITMLTILLWHAYAQVYVHVCAYTWAYTNMGMKQIEIKSTLTKQAGYC